MKIKLAVYPNNTARIVRKEKSEAAMVHARARFFEVEVYYEELTPLSLQIVEEKS